MIDKPPQQAEALGVAQSALTLFVSALNLLYPTAGEKQKLLESYIQQYGANELSAQEAYVLQLMLKQFSGTGL